MNKVARFLFLLVAVILPILIGALHTYVHFQDLVSSKAQSLLQEEIVIMGEAQVIWNTWGLVSFMMGMSFVVIGILNLIHFKSLTSREYPSVLVIAAMIVYQLSVIYVGYEFNQGMQYYGGLFGLALLIICGILTIKKR